MVKRAIQKWTVIPALAVVSLLASCSTDIDLLEDYKPITVVYGLLNVDDSIQYIKINKAFLGEGNALVMAQQSDSINYKPGELTVQLQKLNPSTGDVLQIFTCDTTTVIQKDDGLFSNPYQLLYKTTAAIDASSKYKLVINRSVDGAVISAVTPVVDSVKVTSPNPVSLIRFFSSSPTDHYLTFSLKWLHSADAEIYSALLRFTYYDSLLIPPFTKDTVTLELNLGEVTRGTAHVGDPKEIQLDGENFYSFIDASVNPNPNAVRWAEPVLEISLSAGAEDFYTYIQVNKPSIGLIQEKPVFSNVTNGTGIFSSRWTRVIRQRMDAASATKAQEFLD